MKSSQVDCDHKILEALQPFNYADKKSSWMQRYEFYKPKDCVGSCYLGQTASLRVRKIVDKNHTDRPFIDLKHQNGLLSVRRATTKKKTTDRAVCSTVILKDLFNPIVISKKKEKVLKRKQSSIEDDNKIISDFGIQNGECLQPVDPEEQLLFLNTVHQKEESVSSNLPNNSYIKEILQKHLDEAIVLNSVTETLQLVKRRHKKFKRHFCKLEESRSLISTDYRAALKRAFLDCFFSDEENRRAFNVKYWASPYPVFHIRGPVSWHQNVLNGKNFTRHNLFISHPAQIALRNLWFKKYENKDILDEFLDMLPLELDFLSEIIEKRCHDFKNMLITKWIPDCKKIINCEETVDYVKTLEQKQMRKFFDSIYSLMSLQLRRSIDNCVKSFLRFILSYKEGNEFSLPYEDFKFMEQPFIIIKLKPISSQPFAECCPSFQQIENTFQYLFQKIIEIGKEIPRIERKSSPDQFLMPVRVTENYIQQMIHQTLACCEKNFSGPEQYIRFYQPYSYIFESELKMLLEDSLQGQSLSIIKTYKDKMDELIALQETITTFRQNIPLNMVNLKCNDFNEAVGSRVCDLKKIITDFFLNDGMIHNERIIARFEEIARKCSETPDSTKALVELQNFIHNSKIEVSFTTKKELAKSAEYLEFLLCYSEVPESFISINTKLFRWPTHLEHILELATARISHKIEIVENNLKLKISKFNDTLIDRQKQLDIIKKKDPPILSITEMKDTVIHLDHFMSTLKEDITRANDINTEEDLLNIGPTPYHNLFNIISTLKPFNELWHVVLNFHESYDVWCNNPFINLNAADVKKSVQDMKEALNRLSKCFYDVAGAKRIVEIVLTKVEKFNINIPILETVCNPGLQERHWEKINNTIGVQIKRTLNTTFLEILNYGINKDIKFLQEINIAATEEYTLEKSLLKMKDEWNAIHIQHEIYRDTGMPVITGIDDIQVMLDDYLLRIQTMRGSPYIGAIEDDVEAWEDKLILMQDMLDLWFQVQSTWLYLEPLFNSEDIMRQMPEESERFNDVNKIWNDIMSYAIENPQILNVIEYPDIMSTLQKSNAILEGIKKGLNEYLEKKRLVFPRFFFLSNHELLEILSESKNFSKIQSHLKCFEGISSLEMTENYDILGIISSTGEVVPLNSAISPAEAKGIVERWLDQLEDSMIQSLCDINNKAVRTYSITQTVEWLFQWPTMVAYCALYTNWTADMESSLKDNKLQNCQKKYQNLLGQLMDLLDTELIHRHRSTISTLAALFIYLLEITDNLLAEDTVSLKPNSVHWLKHLRYYNEEQTTCVRFLRTTLSYGYEYLGDFIRLIMTPQTERYYRLMSSCVEQNLFACLLGASGTGKSEISKDFSKVVAKPYCSLKCCERVGYKVISTFLKGCVQMGAWVCFDGIDNMRCEELAVVAEEIRSIQQAVSEKTHRFRFENVEVPLNLTCNITFVFNRTENFNIQLPDNLRRVFRPIVFSTQNYFNIIETSLRSYGFKESSRLAQQILELHELLNELPFQEHQRSTLRSLKKVLEYLRDLKFESDSACEFSLVRKAVLFVYSSKFTKKELVFFSDNFEIIFKQVEAPKEKGENELTDNIRQTLVQKNLTPVDEYIRKVVQLYDRLRMRQNTIILGPSLVGKTKAYQVLVEVFKNSPQAEDVRYCVINPTAITNEQLYGQLNSETGEWTDGILTKIYREYAYNADLTRKWIILDGVMNHSWTERLISVLNENKMCLISGEILQKPDNVNFIFETDSLDFVSPALLHSCAIVSFENSAVEWRCIFASYLNTLKEKLLDEQIEIVETLVEWLVTAVLAFMQENIHSKMTYGQNYMMHQFIKLMTCILKSEEEELGYSNIWLQSVILVSIVWSFAAGLSDGDELLFDTFYRNLLVGQNDLYPIPEKLKSMKQSQFPDKNTVFDWICTKQGSDMWIPWTQTTVNTSLMDSQVDDMSIFVDTEESARQLYFMKLLVQNQEPILIVGPQGSGKTRTFVRHLQQLSSDKYITNFINLSSHVNANRIQNKIMSKIDRRRKGVYGPAMGKKIIFAFDDFETVTRHDTGQDIIELLRQLLEYRYWYDLEDFCRIDLIDFIFAAILTRTDTIPRIYARFIHQVNLIYTKTFNEDTITNIFTEILDAHFQKKEFLAQIQGQSQVLVSATLEIYKKTKSILKGYQTMPQYFIDLKDLSRVFTGIALMNGQFCQGVDELFRLWVHEIMRVFGDKVSSDREREDILTVIKTASCHHLRQRTEQYMSHLISEGENTVHINDLRRLRFTSLTMNGINDYDEVANMETLINQMRSLAEDYNVKYKKAVPCVIFQFIVECTLTATRALQKDMGHILVIGLVGSGRHTILRLAALVLDLEVTEVKISSRYGVENWHNDLKQILWKAGAENTRQLLILPGDGLNKDEMLDDVNTLVNTADLSDIYSFEEKSNIVNKMMDAVHEECLKLVTTPFTLYNFFVKRIRNNLHLAITMSPVSSVFYKRLHACPGFLKCCSVYWFNAWPEDALKNLANELLREEIIFKDRQLLIKCIEFCKKIHTTAISNVQRYNEKFNKRFNVTPEIYIKFLQMFQILYKNKIEEIFKKRSRYQQGLEKLNSTADQVTSMQAELQILKPKLLQTSDSTEKLMIKIEQNTVKMEAAKEIVAADEALANEAAAAAQAIRDDCESDLSEAEPALASATNALNTLNSADITVIKAMKNPPSIVKLVLESVCVMKGMKAECRTDVGGNTIEDFWPTCLKLLSDAKILDNLKCYDKENIDPEIMRIIRERFITHADFDPDIVKKVSNACEGLCKWVRAMEIYDRVIKIVRPKKIKLANAEARYASQMEKLNEKRTQLIEVMSKLQVLHDEWAEKSKQKKELEDAIEICSLKLERAAKLLESLKYEKQRWQQLETELNKDSIRSVGDVFLSSAFITYLTIFPTDLRNQIIKSWYKICQETQLPITQHYSFSSTFISSDDIKFWNMAGLPTDVVSVDNYTIISKTTHLSFIIDPQGQAREYIKHAEGENSLKILKASDKNLLAQIEEVLTQMRPVLIEEVVGRPDDLLLSLIKPEYVIIDGVTYLKLIDNNVVCDRLPKIYISTFQYHEYICDIYNHATLINFEIIPEQLEHRLLKIIISVDAPDLESQHNDLLLKCAEDCQSLYQTEDKILNVLSSSDGNILEDETALQTLNDSKNLLEEIRAKQRESSLAEESLKLAYAPFKKISDLASRIFFAIAKLGQLNVFYQFSFDWFISLFHQAVQKAEKSKHLEERISFVNKYFLRSLHSDLEQLLDEKYLLVVKFFIVVQMNSDEDFMMSDAEIFSDNLCSSFEDLKTCSMLRKEKSEFVDSFSDYKCALFELKKLFEYFKVRNIIPSALVESLGSNSFVAIVEEFIIDQFNPDEESLDLYEVYHNSDDRMPIICGFTSFDVDPLIDILSLSCEIGLPDNTIKCIPFSKMRMQTKLMDIISIALKEGKWIVVHDFHLLEKTFDDIVYLLNRISATDEVHSQFKLWIITFPSDQFPVTILLKGVKITMKDNKYLGSILHQLYTYSSVHVPQLFENHKSNKRWNFNFFLVCFCHAVLKTIQKHGNRFLNTSCDFTKQNFRLSTSFLEIFSANDEHTFVDDFKYLLRECNYGAHFYENTDQFTLSMIVNSLEVEDIENPSYIEIISTRFKIPQDTSFNASIRFIQSLPKTNLLEDFNLYHYLALQQVQTTIDFWKLTRKLYCVGIEKDENFIEPLISDVRIAISIFDHVGNFIASSKELLNIYLSQEVALYRRLIQSIIASLENLKKVNLNKSSVVSEEVQSILLKLKNNEIPTCWSRWSYPFTFSLKPYITNLNRRLMFVHKWIHYGQPEIIWLPGLFNVLGFFTTLKFNFSKSHCVSLLDVKLHGEVTGFDMCSVGSKEWKVFYEEKKNRNPSGIFIQGLILIGGYWNKKNMLIEDLTKDNYFDVLPIVWIEPSLHQKSRSNIYSCPLYYTHHISDQQLEFQFPNYITHINLAISASVTKVAQRGVRLIIYLE